MKFVAMFDYNNWMGHLPQNLYHVPICYLALPGTHDSLSYSVTRNSAISPDAPNFAKALNKLFGPLLRCIVYNWAKTQFDDIEKQLKLGIRYYDLRVAVKPKTCAIYSCHGLFGTLIEQALTCVDKFLNEHSREIVILDLQHFYSFTRNNHRDFVSTLQNIFKNKLCPPQDDFSNVTLHWLWQNKYQVIVIYRDDYVSETEFWPSEKLLTLWPDTTNINQLCSFLSQSLKSRPANFGYVSQCVLTPSIKFILRHVLSTLERTCAIPCNNIISDEWLMSQKAGSVRGVNIIIADFITSDNFKFSSIVIQKNYNLSYRIRFGNHIVQ